MSNDHTTTTLLELLRLLSYKEGTFTLASGKQSDFYIDVKQTALTPKGGALLAKVLFAALVPMIRDGSVAGVAGVVLGGCSLASGVSMFSANTSVPLNALYVRKVAKDHGTKKLVESPIALTPGQRPRVILLEDVITTGGSAISAISAMREAAYDVIHVHAVIDREEGGAEAIAAEGVTVGSLFKRSDFVRPAAPSA